MRGKTWERADAIRELVRGRMEVCGPITASELSDMLILPRSEIEAALLALEAEGFVLRGKFRAARDGTGVVRPPIAGANSSTHDRPAARRNSAGLSRRIFIAFSSPGSALMRNIARKALKVCNLFWNNSTAASCRWPHGNQPSSPRVSTTTIRNGSIGFVFLVAIGWGRLSAPQNPNARAFAPLRTSPIALYQRENLQDWLRTGPAQIPATELSGAARTVFDTLAAGGRAFLHRTGASHRPAAFSSRRSFVATCRARPCHLRQL